jgi:hypothetical protein
MRDDEINHRQMDTLYYPAIGLDRLLVKNNILDSKENIAQTC